MSDSKILQNKATVAQFLAGTHSGEFHGIEPDGSRVVFDGVALCRMEDGKIAETWLTIHEPLLLSQLGSGRARAA